MRTTENLPMEVQVERDPAGSSIGLKMAATAGNDPAIVHLTRDEARRLAAAILFHAAQLDEPQVTWRLPHAALERRSA